ncbi:MAG: rRNA pseudouridine synthase [Bacillales bacterium]|jgi:16S rRNA pseudouridine516 synthase|nr:rRNA pseudouridine synthase [Bacillales bacterium]
MRLDKLLANSGFGTRTEVKKLLKSGLVYVDGKMYKDGSIHVDPEKSNVIVAGESLVYKEFVYIMMNKPQGYISATEDQYLKTVLDLLAPEDIAKGLFPAGRLDRDTEGFLLLTNDGQLAHQLLSPKKHVPKTYFARIDGEVTEEDIEKFKNGVILEDDYETKPADLVILKSGVVSEIELTITEGKFHQVKRMFEAVDKKVLFLKRLSMGKLKLDDSLQLGEYRELTDSELNLIQN